MSKVHWYMKESPVVWGDRWKELMVDNDIYRTQCSATVHANLHCLLFEEFDIQIEQKCKHCHRQWLKMKHALEYHKQYHFYNLDDGDPSHFICKIKMVGFNKFSIDYIQFTYEKKVNEKWEICNIKNEFDKRMTRKDLDEWEIAPSQEEDIIFWKQYYKINKI